MIDVVVAEDSPTARALLVEVLNSDPHIRIVGEAENGLEAVELAQRLRPHVVTMDIRMPLLDGLSATKEIMITAPTPIVIVTANTAITEVQGAMHALRAGAVAALRKPIGPADPRFEDDCRQLLETVKAMARVKVVRHWRPMPAFERRAIPSGDGACKHVVAIATSTGGPAALQHILTRLPSDFPAPILVVQHISAGFAPGLVAWLNSACDLRVKVAEPGECLAPHTVYVAPDDRHLGLANRRTVALDDAPPINGFRPSGNHLFESVARVFGNSVIAAILTGMGQDGVAGLHAVRKTGGRIIAQDEASAVVFGMPAAAIAAGLADEIVPLTGIASRLIAMVERESRTLRQTEIK
jgi:two-component system, chemotaxis family, protein-glutamate methylesterase/glutaminase